jgi:acetoin utilization protein AcuB
MLVGNWMSKTPVTVTPDTSMMRASKALKDKRIRTLCVVDRQGRAARRGHRPRHQGSLALQGHHSGRARAVTTLLSEIKVKDIMSTKIVTITPDESVEKAAILMMDNKIGGLPVVDKAGTLVGVITQTDVFNVLISITGVLHGGLHWPSTCPTTPAPWAASSPSSTPTGADHGACSPPTSPRAPPRARSSSAPGHGPLQENKLMEELRAKYTILFVLRDEKHPALGK